MQQQAGLRTQIGSLPVETDRKSRLRFHQGWWRAFVLAEPAGPYPKRPEATLCSAIRGGEVSEKNLLGPGTAEAVASTLDGRDSQSGGLIDRQRLYNNMLSSQPLAFNFFGPLQQDLALATRLAQVLFPSIAEVTRVRFEHAPADRADNSAFDVVLDVEANGKRGLIGLECKFTEPFSPKVYDKPRYREIAQRSGAFRAPYEACIVPAFNQLFRNQLVAEQLREEEGLAFCMTGLFCDNGDGAAIATGKAFSSMLADGDKSFHIITFARFIEALQMLTLTWEQREWSMMLWARYCALALSAGAHAEQQA
jgi:hypothetical protein